MQLWDVESGRPLGDLFRHEQNPLARWMAAAATACSPDGRRIATVAGDQTAHLWDTTTGYPVTVPFLHNSQVEGVDFNQDGRRIVTESEKAALVWDVAVDSTSVLPPWLPELAEALAGKRLDENGRLVPPGRSLIELRQELLALRGDDFWSRLGRWFFTRGPDRTISPTSDLTLRELALLRAQPPRKPEGSAH